MLSSVARREPPNPGHLVEVGVGRNDEVEAGLQCRGRMHRVAIGVEFRNECLRMDLSLSRRFTTSTSVSPTTDIGFSVDLLGFGGSAKAGPARACRS